MVKTKDVFEPDPDPEATKAALLERLDAVRRKVQGDPPNRLPYADPE